MVGKRQFTNRELLKDTGTGRQELGERIMTQRNHVRAGVFQKSSFTWLCASVYIISYQAVSAAPALRLAKSTAGASYTDPELFIADEFVVVLTREARSQIQVTRDQNDKPATNLTSLQARMTAARATEFAREFPTAKSYPVGHKFPDLTGHYIVKIESGADLKTAMDEFRADPNVEHVEKIGVHPVYTSPNDSFFVGSQWNMKPPYGINGPPAWKIENGNPSVIIAIMDTGVRYFHNDLGGNNAPWGPGNPQTNGNIFVNTREIPGNGIDDDGNGFVDDTIGYDFLASSTVSGCTCVDLDCTTADNDPDDYNGHGTHVAGIAAAMTNNARGVAGTAGGFGTGVVGSPGDGARIMPLRIGWQANCTGSGIVGLVSMAAAAQAMNYVATMVDNGVNITAVNCSWGSSDTGGFGVALAAAQARDVMIVHAAGNGGSSTPDFLGSQSSVVNVAATQSNGTGYTSTNFGPWVDIAAPGVNITSTVRNSADPNPNNNYYASYTGTSMAAPHVCGVAALLESCRPDLTAQDKIEIMQQTAIPYIDARDLGDGILNAYNAVQEACLVNVKFDQPLSGPGEDLSSNVDVTDLSPAAVQADDFVSDGRPITRVDWWGSEISDFPVFRVDDGNAENSIGVNNNGGPPGNTFGWANRFTNTTGGPVTITTIYVAFGFPGGATGVNIGDAVDGIIWLDAAATGDFNNAVPAIRWSLPGGVHANDGVTFAAHTVPGGGVVVPAGADFYVGCGDIQTQNDSLVRYPAAIDETAPSAVRSWAFIPNDNTFTEVIPGQTVGTIDGFGLPGNWLIRAGGNPVPTPDGWFISFHEPLSTGGAPPAQPLGLYFCDSSIVPVHAVDAATCDGQSVFKYRADLQNCCLLHAEVDSRSGRTPAQTAAFNEEQCFSYAIDIQAVIGAKYADSGGTCVATSTGRSASANFWGWHTTAIARGVSFGLQPALQSQSSMSGSDWLYGPWVAASPVCSSPNMAFSLTTTTLVAGNPDLDGNGVPDVCDAPPPVNPDPSGINKTRFISFSAPGGHLPPETALRVKLTSLHHVDPPYTGGASVPFTAFESQAQYVGPPISYVESASSGIPFYASQLQCAPYYQNWNTVGLLHVSGEAIVPSSTYNVENLAANCAGHELSCAAVSAPLAIKTTRWGDVETPYNPPSPDPQPDTSDISALVNKFKSALGAPIKARALLAGGNARGTMGPAEISPDFNFTHISLCVDAFKGLPYPYKPGKCTGDPAKACIANADCTNAPNPTTGPCILCP